MAGSERQPQEVLFVLECISAGRGDERAFRWRAYLDVEDEVWIYRPECGSWSSVTTEP